MYCDGHSEQLAAQEEKRKQAKKGQLNGDGLPRLLTSDKFHKCVVEHHKANEDEAITRENHQRQWDAQAGVMAEWKEVDEMRKKWNKERRAAYHEAMHLWEEEKALVKHEKRQVRWEKPKLGKLESPAPKPVLEGEGDEAVADGDKDSNENNAENDEGMDVDGE
ncbi:hypothetical protein BDN67DRAFT_901904 [Paxillus ammoniavirescens]|nr:hypothetical protein BDN67DRAFT_901904 [Paxillus ammoniavirescens]